MPLSEFDHIVLNGVHTLCEIKEKVDIHDIDSYLPNLRIANFSTLQKCLLYLEKVDLIRKIKTNKNYAYELTEKGMDLVDWSGLDGNGTEIHLNTITKITRFSDDEAETHIIRLVREDRHLGSYDPDTRVFKTGMDIHQYLLHIQTQVTQTKELQKETVENR